MNLSIAKVWFGLSLLVLAFGYGFASHAWGLFPKTFVERAWQQAYWQVFASDDGSGALTSSKVYDSGMVRQVDPESMAPGMTLIVSSWEWGSADELIPGAKLVNEEGEVLHSWQPDRSDLFPNPAGLINSNPSKEDFHGSYLLPGGDLILALTYIGAVRVDACGDLVWRLKQGNHHSVARADDGSFWIPGTSSERRTSTPAFPDGFPGIDKPVWLDQVVHVSKGGEVLDKINVLDVLYENDLERHIVKSMGPYPALGDVRDDPVHLNDIEPLDSSVAEEYPLFEAGDLLISLRHPSLVLVFDPDSKEVKWHDSENWIHQHDPDFIGGGWVGIFDNNTDLGGRGEMLGGSRIVAVQPHTDSTAVRFPTDRSESFYTSVRGKWQKLENGNMLLTETNPGRVVEVAPDGHTVWEWIHEPHDDSRVPFVTKATRHDLTREEIASWPCSSVDSISASAQNTSTQNQRIAP
jgi:hypothetical protein